MANTKKVVIELDQTVLKDIPALSTGVALDFIDVNGYLRSGANGRLIHREVYYNAFPKMPRSWQIHHINGNKLDNDLENLICLSPISHRRLHNTWTMQCLPKRDVIESWLKRKRPLKSKKKKKVTKGIVKRRSILLKKWRKQRKAFENSFKYMRVR